MTQQTEYKTSIERIRAYIEEMIRAGLRDIRVVDRPYGVSVETQWFEYIAPGVSLDELQDVLARSGIKVRRDENTLIVEP